MSLGLVGCSNASAGRSPPSAAELLARADIDEVSAASASPSEARSLFEAAREYRSEARTLSERADRLCADVPESDRARPSILSAAAVDVRPLMGEHRLVKTTIPEVRGAELLIRATAGLTKQWVARLIRCHVAWLAVAGARSSPAASNPFLVDTAEVSFDEEETGFVVRVRGADKTAGEEILGRARRFLGPLESSSSP